MNDIGTKLLQGPMEAKHVEWTVPTRGDVQRLKVHLLVHADSVRRMREC